MKTLLKAIIAIAAIITMASCAKENKSDSRVAIIFPSGEKIARWSSDLENILIAMSEYGIDTKQYVAADDEIGALEQVDQIRDAIKLGIKNIVLVPIDYNAINKAGVLEGRYDVNVICHDRLIMNNSNIDYYSSCDRSQVGIMQAQYLIQAFKASGRSSMTLEMFAGPESDDNSKYFFEGAYNLLKPYIDNGQLTVKSGRTKYSDVCLTAWDRYEAEANFAETLSNYYFGNQVPDLILCPNDITAFGVISAIEQNRPGLSKYPIITGQDNSDESHAYIKSGKLAMTIDKSLKAMAYNTAMVVSTLYKGSRPVSYEYINNGAVEVPLIKSQLVLITADNL